MEKTSRVGVLGLVQRSHPNERINRRTVIATIAAFVFSTAVSEAASFQIGDFITYSQESWGGDPGTEPAAQLLVAHFNAVYGGGVEIGIPVNAGYSMIFTSAAAALNYLPSSGSPAPLSADLIDPTSTSSGLWGGSVLALQFNVDSTDAGYLSGSAGVPFGDLILSDLAFTPEFNGFTVRQFLAEANSRLGGGPGSTTYDELAILTLDLNSAFEGGVPTQWAEDHLVIASQPVPEPTSLLLFGSGTLGVLARMRRRKQQ